MTRRRWTLSFGQPLQPPLPARPTDQCAWSSRRRPQRVSGPTWPPTMVDRRSRPAVAGSGWCWRWRSPSSSIARRRLRRPRSPSWRPLTSSTCPAAIQTDPDRPPRLGRVGGDSSGLVRGALDRRCERRGHGSLRHVWTPRGPVEGLGLLPDAVVVPHFSPSGMTAWRHSLAQIARPSTTWIGLDERTAILGMPGEDQWRVVGQGAAHIAFGDASTGVVPGRVDREPRRPIPRATVPDGARHRSVSSLRDDRPIALATRPRSLVPEPWLVRGLSGTGPRGAAGVARSDGSGTGALPGPGAPRPARRRAQRCCRVPRRRRGRYRVRAQRHDRRLDGARVAPFRAGRRAADDRP